MVEEYISSGRDNNVVDPDKNKSLQRENNDWQQYNTESDVATNSRTTAVKYPLYGCSTKLSRLPMFTRAEIDVHISKSGKSG